MKHSLCSALLLMSALSTGSNVLIAHADDEKCVQLATQSVSQPAGSGVPELTTEELKQVLVDQSALVLDTRPFLEWSISHIPGAVSVAPKPGVPMALYTSDVAEIGRLVNDDKAQALVLYCNGPFCGKSRRVAAELTEAGYTDVRRYQLGAPVWRALVGIMEIAPKGLEYVFENDQTAVWIDVREPSAYEAGTIQGARNLPHSGVLPGKDVGEVFRAKNDGRLPMEDHNTRIIVFGDQEQQAGEVAEALAREAFHNVAFFAGTYAALTEAIAE